MQDICVILDMKIERQSTETILDRVWKVNEISVSTCENLSNILFWFVT